MNKQKIGLLVTVIEKFGQGWANLKDFRSVSMMMVVVCLKSWCFSRNLEIKAVVLLLVSILATG